MVECRFYTADTAVQFCHEVPNNTCRRFEPVTSYQNQCGCAAERLGSGLQIRFMQVRFLSPTPINIGSNRLKDIWFHSVVDYHDVYV